MREGQVVTSGCGWRLTLNVLLCQSELSCVPVRPVQDASLCSRFGSGLITSWLRKGAAISYGHGCRIIIGFVLRVGWRLDTKHFVSNQQWNVSHFLMRLLKIPQGYWELSKLDRVVCFIARTHFMKKGSVCGILLDTAVDVFINIINGTVEFSVRYSAGQEISCFYGMQSFVTVF